MAKQTATKDTAAQKNIAQEPPDTSKQQVATLAPARLPYHPVYKERYGVDGMMWRALVEAVFPSAKTVEGIVLAISYCKSKNYDIMKKMVNVVPIWNSQLRKEVEGVWEAVAALRATAFRTGEYAGCDETKFGTVKTFHFDDEVGYGDKAERVIMDVEMPEWAQVTVYRMIQGQRCAFPGPRVFYLGAYGSKGKSEIPNEKWGTSTDSYMLEKCAEAAALRKAFPEALGGVNAWEEMEGRKLNIPGSTIDHDVAADAPPRPTRDSTKADEARARKEEEERQEEYRQAMAAGERNRQQSANQDSAKTVEHDAETGEVQDERPPTTGADVTNHDATPDKTGDKPAPQPPKVVDYVQMTAMLMDKIQATSKSKILDAVIQDYAEELEALRLESADNYAAVQKEIAGRRAWFSR